MKRFISAKGFGGAVILFFLLGMYLTSCKKTIVPYPIYAGLNITSYVESDPNYSLFDQILLRTKYDGFLALYGSYTVFLPTNNAITLYLKGAGKSSVNDVNIDSLKDFVRYHVIQNDTLSTTDFIDGKIRTPTLLGQYLISGSTNIAGVSSYIINAQALITKSNIRCGNGIVHVIDHVLKPASNTIAQLIDQDIKYKIFGQALRATGFYDTLNVSAKNNPNKSRNYFTVFAQSDSLYLTLGIHNLTELQARYSTPGSNPLHNVNDGLYAYVAYHILPEYSYLTDILSSNSHSTLSPTLDVISDVLQNQTIVLNYDYILGTQYPGAAIDRTHSNVSANNGVLHTILADLYIKNFPPTRVDWDLADQPEFRKQTSIFRVPGKSSANYFNTAPLTNISWTGPATVAVNYVCQAANNNTYFWNNDCLATGNIRPTAGAGINTMTFTSPVVVKGKYKIWIMWQRGGTAGLQFFLDDMPLQNVITSLQNIYGNTTDTGPVLESKGVKRYNEAPSSNAFYTQCVGFNLGTVTLTTTTTHRLKFVVISSGGSTGANFDMVQFIPFDQDQENPRYFRRDGTVTN